VSGTGATTRLPYVWDYDLDVHQFRRLLPGDLVIGRLDRTWATVRLLEYAPYREIVRMMGFRDLVRRVAPLSSSSILGRPESLRERRRAPGERLFLLAGPG